jgi:hypothetical protein
MHPGESATQGSHAEPLARRDHALLPGSVMDVHFKLFGTDGVSLQSQELGHELRRRNWRAFACAADVPPGSNGVRIPALAYQSAAARALRQRMFHPAATAPVGALAQLPIQDIRNLIEARAERIHQRVAAYLHQHRIQLLHIRNLMSLPLNLPATLAFYRLAKASPAVHCILHHHDLYWEGPNAHNFYTPYPEIADLIDTIICPDLPNTTHVLINPIAAEALQAKKGIPGSVIPDGFDFDRRVEPLDEATFRRNLEILTGEKKPILENDLVVGMMARVAINKAIELAIQFTNGLQQKRAQLENIIGGIGSKKRQFTKDNRIVLLLAQGEDIHESRDYFHRLQEYAKHLGVTLAYAGNIVTPDSKYLPDGKHYPFYSTYQTVDFVCYPPEHEGFGNQAIEAVWAKRPLAVLEYPVFQRYVRGHIPHYVSLGDTQSLGRLEQFGGLHLLQKETLDKAVSEAIAVLRDHDLERQWVEENAAKLRRFCGIEHVTDRYITLYNHARRNMM